MAHHNDLEPLRLTAVSPDPPEQVAELAALAEETFVEAYADKVDAAVLVRYAKDVVAPDLRGALARGEADAFWVRNSAAVAYATVRLPSAAERPTTIHLDRIYVRASNRGQGLGRLLVDEAVSVGKRAGMTRICLGVWEANTPAIAFYEALGFAPCGEETFQLGSLRQRDVVMCRRLI
jgi:ribosomal protein S18 acetylase RimI-like enzyme